MMGDHQAPAPFTEFVASLAQNASAIKAHGADGSVRVTLDVPATHSADALRLLLLTGVAFTVTVRPGE